jgi:hypothetical protein
VDPQRYARVKEVFREAMRWAPEEREAVVAALAADDAAVRDEVRSLLAHHDDAPLIREPAPGGDGVAGEAPPAAAPGDGRAGSVAEQRTLAELLRTERAGGTAAGWPLERVVRILDPIAEALAIAADRGVVHGAVRADQVVIAEIGEEIVATLAGLDAAEPRAPTASPLEGGQAASAAPEQVLPALGPVGPWTDVYALAVLCVELMLGRPVAEGGAVAALGRARDEAAQPTPRAVGLAVPDAVDAVMAMAMAMRPMERYQDVGRFWRALRDSLAASRPALLAPRPPPTLPSAKHRGPAWELLGVIILLIVAAVVLAQRCG